MTGTAVDEGGTARVHNKMSSVESRPHVVGIDGVDTLSVIEDVRRE